jgi:hypothetical protein
VTSLPEVRGARPGAGRHGEAAALGHLEPAVETAGAPVGSVGLLPGHARTTRSRFGRARLHALAVALRYPLTVYAATRVLYLLIAALDTVVRHDIHGNHWSIGHEMANWDGRWYLNVVRDGYPSQLPPHGLQTTLGFFPLYPLLITLLSHATGAEIHLSGALISLVTGASATVLVWKLAERWFDPAAARRAVLFFCIFPGSIVFSMLYTEGLLITLIAGCLLALQDRRWVLAGVLAGLSTAVGPVAMAIVPACAGAALLHLHRHGWTSPRNWRALLAPVLAPLGAVATGAYMWVHTGSPFAVYIAQRYGWHESSTPWAIPRLVESLVQEIDGTAVVHPQIDLNIIAGLLGTAFLFWALRLAWRNRTRVPVPAILWTLGITGLTLTSNATAPNARMLLCAFPALVVVAKEIESRKGKQWLYATTLVLTIAMSIVTYVSTGLRP